MIQTGDRHEVMGPPKAWFEINGIRYIYEVIGMYGIKEEGQPNHAYFSTLELCLDAFQKQVDAYLAVHPGWIFWRRLPEWQSVPAIIENEPRTLYVCTARLTTVDIN